LLFHRHGGRANAAAVWSRLSFAADTKALGCSDVAGVPVGEGQPLFAKPKRPTVEGTPGAVKTASFRERTEETALQGSPSRSLASQVDRFERGRVRTAAGHHSLPRGVQHRFMTGGVRAKQVGVNPWGERSLQRGVANASCATRPLACGNLAGRFPLGERPLGNVVACYGNVSEVWASRWCVRGSANCRSR
jgi:hypothetical protein